MNQEVSRDTAAWRFYVWAAFVCSVGVTAVGIGYLPVEPWVRAFMAMGLLFVVGSSFTLAKTLRDDHEAKRLLSKLNEAKTERILREYEMGPSPQQAA